MTDWYQRSKSDPQFYEQPLPAPNEADEQRAFMRTMRQRFIPLAWFALAMNLGMLVTRIVQHDWFGCGAAVATSGIVVVSLRIFYRFKTWQ